MGNLLIFPSRVTAVRLIILHEIACDFAADAQHCRSLTRSKRIALAEMQRLAASLPDGEAVANSVARLVSLSTALTANGRPPHQSIEFRWWRWRVVAAGADLLEICDAYARRIGVTLEPLSWEGSVR